ncbi:hypothetical protein [Leptolyngbya ohadii]|nr:hypothetical protein [Leptolyngbya ohadii]
MNCRNLGLDSLSECATDFVTNPTEKGLALCKQDYSLLDFRAAIAF